MQPLTASKLLRTSIQKEPHCDLGGAWVVCVRGGPKNYGALPAVATYPIRTFLFTFL